MNLKTFVFLMHKTYTTDQSLQQPTSSEVFTENCIKNDRSVVASDGKNVDLSKVGINNTTISSPIVSVPGYFAKIGFKSCHFESFESEMTALQTEWDRYKVDSLVELEVKNMFFEELKELKLEQKKCENEFSFLVQQISNSFELNSKYTKTLINELRDINVRRKELNVCVCNSNKMGLTLFSHIKTFEILAKIQAIWDRLILLHYEEGDWISTNAYHENLASERSDIKYNLDVYTEDLVEINEIIDNKQKEYANKDISQKEKRVLTKELIMDALQRIEDIPQYIINMDPVPEEIKKHYIFEDNREYFDSKISQTYLLLSIIKTRNSDLISKWSYIKNNFQKLIEKFTEFKQLKYGPSLEIMREKYEDSKKIYRDKVMSGLKSLVPTDLPMTNDELNSEYNNMRDFKIFATKAIQDSQESAKKLKVRLADLCNIEVSYISAYTKGTVEERKNIEAKINTCYEKKREINMD